MTEQELKQERKVLFLELDTLRVQLKTTQDELEAVKNKYESGVTGSKRDLQTKLEQQKLKCARQQSELGRLNKQLTTITKAHEMSCSDFVGKESELATVTAERNKAAYERDGYIEKGIALQDDLIKVTAERDEWKSNFESEYESNVRRNEEITELTRQRDIAVEALNSIEGAHSNDREIISEALAAIKGEV